MAGLADRYVIDREIGSGGMATVYLAHDLRHDRKVALKVLRPELSAILGAERFLVEIKTTANLQHPHILPLYDSGEIDGSVFYVMPFVQGETLRERITRERQLPIEDAVRIAKEVGGALDYAHRHGLVHRDIKPENILLHDGSAMVADFGIALAVSRSDGGTRMTETGMSLGTPHYMSPEQATGEREITARSDIYALGAMLYEMLSGEPPFTGPTAQAIIARVMTEQPRGLGIQRRSVPPNVEAATMKALEKLPADRFGSAAQFVEALSNATFAAATGYHAAVPQRRPGFAGTVLRAAPWLVAAVAVVAAVALYRSYSALRDKPPEVARQRVHLWGRNPDPGMVFLGLAFAPDDRAIAFVDTVGGTQQIWIKERDQLDAVPLSGAIDGQRPTFSPDGQWIAFAANGSLRKVPRAGGAAITLSDSINTVAPVIAWFDDGRIVFNDPQWNFASVNQSGGTATTHKVYTGVQGPVSGTPLPGARGIIFGGCTYACAQIDLRVWDLRADSSRVLAADAIRAWYLPDGTLVFARRDGALFAAPFDLATLAFTAPPTPVFEGIRSVGGLADVTISSRGTLAYVAGSNVAGGIGVEPVWIDRAGRITVVDSGWVVPLAGAFGFSLSPDGRRVAIGARGGSRSDIWIKELPAGPFTRLTFDGNSGRPRWAVDGAHVMYSSMNDSSVTEIRMRRADGTGAERVLARSDRGIFEPAPLPDTTRLLVRTGGTWRDIMYAVIGSDSLVPLLASRQFRETGHALSPDGNWIAYTSDESGRDEVYVRPFPDVNAGRWQVSRDGGMDAAWAHTGRELFYRSANRELVAVPVAGGSSFTIGAPRPLFPVVYWVDDATHSYGVSPDDQRFLFMRGMGSPTTERAPLIMVEGWSSLLRPRAGSGAAPP
ncbi:MAG: protein kinase domain-containing protein [Gemmatimonadaceae bacterium]